MKKFRAFINKHAGLTSLVAVAIILFSIFTIATNLSGCVKYLDSQGQEVTRLSDETTALLDKGAELAPVVRETLTGLGVVIPGFAALAAGLVTGISVFFGAYKKYRPQITAEHSKAEQASSMTKALVYAIEEFKSSDHENWDSLKQWLTKELREQVGPEAFAIIEALVQEFYEKENK